MRSVAGVAAAFVLAAMSSSRALAQPAAPADDFHWLLFSGVDLWRNGRFAHGGVVWSPDGLTREGFTLKVLLAGGTYEYQAGTMGVTARQRLAAIMPGWRIKQGPLEILFTAGPELQQHGVGPDDPGNRLRGTHWGVRFGGDLWLQPMDNVMVAGAVSIGSVAWQYWTRAQLGVRLAGLGWIGPEYHALGDGSYAQQRWGVHATGFRTSDLEWSVGAATCPIPTIEWAPTAVSGSTFAASAAQSSVRRNRVIAMVMAISVSPASASVSKCRSAMVAPLSMIARTMRR